MKNAVITMLIMAVILCCSGCCLSHQWIDATCTSPKTCSECQKTEGSVLPHSWIDATCTTPQICSVCNKTEGTTLPHTWLSATCTTPQTCSICNTIEGDILPHEWIDATCTDPKTCSVCSKTEGEPMGHTVNEWTISQEPTCTTTGIETGSCSVCNATIDHNLDMLEHTAGEWVVTKEATSSENGERTKYCTECDEVLETEEFERSPEEIKAEFIDSCKSYSYQKIARNPDDYDGKRAVFTGEVIQVQQQDIFGLMYYTLRVNVTKSGRYYEDTVYVTYFASEDDSRILEDDIITMYGELTGEKTYTTVMGASVTIPSFSAEYIDIN